MNKRVYGWKPDLPDQRDRYFKVRRFRALPSFVDLRGKCSDIEDQEDIGSCTAQASVAAMEYLDRIADDKWTDLSRLFVYYNSRPLGDKGEDTGAYIREVIKDALAKHGACDEKLWPYLPSKFGVKPPLKAYRDGLKRCITEYRRIESLEGVKQCLADGFPVIFGFTVYTSFNIIGRSGIMPMPQPDERTEGGHAVLAVGYDDKKQCLIVRNSWGKSWGDQGYFYMPYDYVHPDLTADFWVITRTPLPNGFDPSPDPNVRWYIPIADIAVSVWSWIFGSKQLDKRGD